MDELFVVTDEHGNEIDVFETFEDAIACLDTAPEGECYTCTCITD